MVLPPAIEISGHVAGWDADVAKEGDHGVSKVLADATRVENGLVDGRIYARRTRNIFEELEETAIEFLNDHEGVVAPNDLHSLCQPEKRRGFDGKLTGQEHLPVIAGFDHGIEGLPRVGRERRGNFGHGLLFNDGFGDDHELVVLARDIKMMNVVAEMVAIGEDAAPWADGKREGEAVLV